MRQAFEPWYTPRFNASITNPEFLKLRKSKVSQILGDHLVGQLPSKILDFGGARGELVQNLLPGATAYLYDVSGASPLDGVIACSDLEDCRSHDFDLILSSNVLEHIGTPRDLVGEIRRIAGPRTMFWVEVPYEPPSSVEVLTKRLLQQLVLLVLRPQVALSLARPGMLTLMTEHVSFFGIPSLKRLLESSGWSVTNSGSYGLTGPLGPQKWVWALAKSS